MARARPDPPRSRCRKASHSPQSATANAGSQQIRSATQAASPGAVSSPGTRPASRPAELTAMNAVWCQRNKVIADRLASATSAQASGRRMHRASRSRSSSASPHWAIPNITAARVGGFRFEMAAPFTPTMLAGYPAHTISAAVAAAPPASMSAGPRRPRSEPSAHATPSRYGTSQPAGKLTQPTQDGPPRPNRTRSAAATTTAGNAAANPPSRPASRIATGVSAVSPAYTPRNHSGLTTSVSSVRIVAPGTPAPYRQAVTGIQTATSTATGRARRASRPRSQLT